jgi:hypothetical protein
VRGISRSTSFGKTWILLAGQLGVFDHGAQLDNDTEASASIVSKEEVLFFIFQSYDDLVTKLSELSDLVVYANERLFDQRLELVSPV